MSVLMDKAFLLSKELEDCKKHMDQNEDYDLNKKKSDALKEILDCLLSLDFITDSRSKAQMKEFINLENENSYSTSMTLNLVAKHFSCTDRTIRTKVSKMDTVVEEILTPEIINLLKEDRIDESLSLFRSKVTKDIDFSKIILGEFLGSFPIPKNNGDIKLIDCMPLVYYSMTFIKADIPLALKEFGYDKAAFLIYVLTSNNPQYINEKKLLYDLFSHKININDLYDKLNSLDAKINGRAVL